MISGWNQVINYSPSFNHTLFGWIWENRKEKEKWKYFLSYIFRNREEMRKKKEKWERSSSINVDYMTDENIKCNFSEEVSASAEVEAVVSHFHAYEIGNEASLRYEIKFGKSVMQ